MKSKKWLLLLYQIPAKADSERVRVWRSLQKIGAVTVKNSVSAVPDMDCFRRSIIDIAAQIVSSGGESIVTEGQFLFGISPESLSQTYNAQMDIEFKSIAQEIRNAAKEIPSKPTPTELMKWEHKRTKFNSRLAELEQKLISNTLDGKEICRNNLEAFEKKLNGHQTAKSLKSSKKPKKGATWVTRKNLHVDRLASAWLIKKYIDPQAKFLFVSMDEYNHKSDHVRFDVFSGEYTHDNELCTFEVLVRDFKIKNSSIKILAEIIHDLDIEDKKYERKETEGIRMALDGIIRGNKDDHERLQAAAHLFDSLVLSLK